MSKIFIYSWQSHRIINTISSSTENTQSPFHNRKAAKYSVLETNQGKLSTPPYMKTSRICYSNKRGRITTRLEVYKGVMGVPNVIKV